MNIAALVPELEAPSCRFRIAQYRDPLRKEGIELAVREIPRGLRARYGRLSAAAGFDAVVLHRKLLSLFEFRCLRSAARRLIFDFDDAVMLRDSNSAKFESKSRRRRFSRLVAGADLVIAGNRYLAELAREFNPAVRIIPTPVDLDEFPSRPRPGAGKTIGWVGTSSNFIYLRPVLPALARVLERDPERRLVIVAERRPVLEGIRFEFRPWSPETERSALADFSLGIMPLNDDPWSRGKCSFKILRYFAAFLPVVASPVGMNREVVRPGENGFLALSGEEWEEALEKIISDGALRERLGTEGRKTVEAGFSLASAVPRLIEALRAGS